MSIVTFVKGVVCGNQRVANSIKALAIMTIVVKVYMQKQPHAWQLACISFKKDDFVHVIECLRQLSPA